MISVMGYGFQGQGHTTPIDPITKTAPIAPPHRATAVPIPHNDARARSPRLLVEARRWLLWKSLPQADPNKKQIKKPFYVTGVPRSGQLDSAEDQAKLATYDQAIAAFCEGEYAGLAIALGPDGTGNYWQGFDADNLNPSALDQASRTLPGYVEISPGGKGLHAIGYGKQFKTLGSNGSNVEAYASGRFFTFTGNSGRGEPICIADFVEKTVAYQHRKKPQVEANKLPLIHIDQAALDDLRSALFHLDADEYQLWIEVGQALKSLGESGRSLWLAWSAKSPKFDVAEAVKKWDSFSGERTSYQSIFVKAQDRGWINPNSNKARGTGSSKADAGFSIQLRSAKEMSSRPHMRWRVRGVILQEGIGAIYGQPGAAKSFLALDMLAAIGRCEPWFGRRVRASSVVYAAMEGQAGVAQRVAAYEARKGPMHGVMFIDSQFDLRNEHHRSALIKTMHEASLLNGVLCIDTLAASAPGIDENASTDMGELIGHLNEIQRAIGGFVLVVHHAGKDDARGLRGWSGLNGALDMVIEVIRPSKTEDRREWRISKSKDGVDGLGEPFRLDQVGLGVDED